MHSQCLKYQSIEFIFKASSLRPYLYAISLIEKGKILEKRNNTSLHWQVMSKRLMLRKTVNAHRDQPRIFIPQQGHIRFLMGYYSYALSCQGSLRYSYHAAKKAKNLNNMGIISELLENILKQLNYMNQR